MDFEKKKIIKKHKMSIVFDNTCLKEQALHKYTDYVCACVCEFFLSSCFLYKNFENYRQL